MSAPPSQPSTDAPQAPPPRLGVTIGRKVMRMVDRFFDRHSQVPTTPFMSPSYFPALQPLVDNFGAIRTELDQVLTHRDDIPTFHQLSPDQVRISRGDNWKTFVFYAFANRVDANCAQCPETARLLDALPRLQNAWFSILSPGYHIPPHRGPSKALLRCHLGVRVPKQRESCWIRVGGEVRHWGEGELLCFDDTYEHEVHNDTDETRVVLFIDLDRPLDRVGEAARRTLMFLARRTTYVRRPLANLTRWNERLGIRTD